MDINPTGANLSYAAGVGGGLLVGQAWFASVTTAGLWYPPNQAWIILNSPAGPSGEATATDGLHQVGAIYDNFGGRAALWSGTAASWVDLNPAGASSSSAQGVDQGVQGGYAVFSGRTHAGIWTGSPASFIDLHPPTALTSQVLGISGSTQVGTRVMTAGGSQMATLWQGTAESWVNLHPPAAAWSQASATSGGFQVGAVEFSPIGRARAVLWTGTAASLVDLHAFLPPGHIESRATGVWTDADQTFVIGWAQPFNSEPHAFLWVSNIGTPECAASVTQHPTGGSVLPNTSRQLVADASGPVAGFRWRKNGVPLAESSRFTGTQTPSLIISAFAAADQGTYDCIVQRSCGGTLASDPAPLSCLPSITAQSGDFVLLTPGVQLSVSVPVGASNTYRWRHNGQNLFNIPGLYSGVTTRTLSVLAADPSLEGAYDVVITNTCGVTVSSSIQLSICDRTDFNADGLFPDTADLDDFLSVFSGGPCSNDPNCGDTDFNNDGLYPDTADIDSLLSVFSGGPCL